MQDSQKFIKNNEKAKRVKYIRSLEKFASVAVNTLKKDDFDKDKFKERMLKNMKFFEKNEAVILNANYAKSLENFVNACLDFSKEKSELLNLANALDKLKNKNKKEKHKNYLKDF
ncbi:MULTISPECIES: hypothetical protein [unclassified Campylobacter]|uniref:hypothetical protein n=1 Tax=unclassified Campylobacter TaxID=2593542 RepID=UPI001237E0AF|nr:MULTISPECIES: hypothetical protein [unclassified Campylobacter]KAA6225488.1 hypothetical protein FMM55_06700 [Campylobacter sp. LR196d]KAA6227426.1 hypothetical protein FMM54_02845 [Campylobacter sp. LR185c]KAA6229759.1 hypothetical protein FMM57_00370 [Campylobacter sp. LR286c]KAA6234284.1 hypothetical protein FMM58_00345 [Campylobacter sp. LR291e]KAA6234503.1 hypothetical protein FMM56_00355 [Campylobacter sp. LR264d]